MLLGEALVDFTAHHALEYTLGADAAKVHVTQRDGDQEKTRRGMDDVPELHRLAHGAEVREQQEEAGYGHCNADEEHEPVEDFLTRVEEPGRRMAVTDGAAQGFEPLEVDVHQL